MDTSTYTALTGIPVNASNSARINAAIRKTQAMLEELLGYSLDTQTGSSQRVFLRKKEDRNKMIDPCTAVSAVELRKNGTVVHTYAADEYSPIEKFGLIKYLRIHKCPICFFEFCICLDPLYEYVVTATWAFQSDPPDSLLGVWADMITFYADPSNNIQRENLGSHEYWKFAKERAEELSGNMAIIRRYAGPRGTLGILPL